ncbi:ankyrin repeat domain-containing protein [Legionella sp. CNM-1927-20]|uniref:ankyrin repeat domain-containing protein n=1 Tax=Legionella sp. CNM-1927-20 TaxID=3422221 RepID=UPI00403AEAC5
MPRKILIRPDLESKLLEEAGHKKALSHFMNEQDKKGLNLEKLQGSLGEQALYTIRTNKKSRLVLCPVASPTGQVWLLIEILTHHDYEKLKEKPQGWLSRQIAKTQQAEIEFTEVLEEQQTGKEEADEGDNDIIIESSSRIEFYNQRFILFSEGQAKAKAAGEHAMPCVVTGPPGCGKTSVGSSVVRQNVLRAMNNQSEPKPILVLAKSANLIHFLAQDWQAFCAEFPEEMDSAWVVFKTPQMLYQDNHGAVTFKGEDEFIAWFCKELETQNQLKKKDKTALPLPVRKEEAPLVYQELHTMSGYSSFEEYRDLVTSKLSLFPNLDTRECEWLWQVYEHYMKKLASNKEVDLAFLPIELQKTYDFIVVDEAQDLSRRQISSLAQQSERIIFCVGDHQRLFGSETTVPFIRSVYRQKAGKDITTVVQLDASYRCPNEVIALANGVLRLKYQAIGGKEFLDKNELVSVQANPALSQAGNVYWLEQKKELSPLINDRHNVQFAVITSPEFIAEAASLFGRERVFTPESIKGLEYDHVLLYRLLEQDEYKQANPAIGEGFDAQNASVAKSTEGSIRHSTAFNELFVAVTRAQVSVSIYQPPLRDIRFISEALKQLVAALTNSPSNNNNNNNNNPPVHVQSKATQSSAEEWRQRVALLRQQGLDDQAQAIIDKYLQDDKTPSVSVVAEAKHLTATSQTSTSTGYGTRRKKASKKATPSNPSRHLLEDVINNKPGAMEKLLQHKEVIHYLFHTALNTINANLPALSLMDYFKTEQDKGKDNALLKALINRLNEVAKWAKPTQAQQEQQDAFMALLYYKPDSLPFSLSTLLLKQLTAGSQAYSFILQFKNKRREELTKELAKGHLKAVEALQRLGLLNAWDSQGNTPAQVAICSGQWEIFDVLVKRGAEVNKPSKIGVTSLIMAAKFNQVKVITQLKALGAKINISQTGETSLYIASERGHVGAINALLANLSEEQIVELIYKPDANGATPLFAAAYNGHVGAINALLANLGEEQVAELINQPMANGATPLFVAAQNGHVPVINRLKELNAKVNLSLNTGETPLYIAAQNGRVDAINALLANLSSEQIAELINQPNVNGTTPLFIAAQKGHVPVINRLKELNAKVNLSCNTGETPLYIAACNGHVDVINALLANLSSEQIAELINKPAANGTTPLYIAAYNGHVDVINALLANLSREQIAELINQSMANGATPLFIAAQEGHVPVIKRLKELNAKVNLSLDTGATPLFIAAYHGHVDAINALLANLSSEQIAELINQFDVDGATPLFIAAQQGHVPVINRLKELNAKVNLSCNTGATPLYTAACHGHVAAINALLANLSSEQIAELINQPGADGTTPLYIAAQHGHVPVIKRLKELNAKVNLPRNTGATPLYIAAQNGHVDAINALLANLNEEQIAELINHPTADGATPLYIAAQNGHVDVINALLANLNEEQIAELINHPTAVGATPLFVAAQHGHVLVIKRLRELNAKVNLSLNTGETPLFTAAYYGHVDAINALLANLSSEHIAELINKPNAKSATPLFAAAQKGGHTSIVSCLLNIGASCFDACQTNSEILISVAKDSGKEETLARAKTFIESKGLTVDSTEKTLPILPHEIAYIMGHNEIGQLIQAKMSLPPIHINSHFGFFKEEKAAKSKVDEALQRDKNSSITDKVYT